MKKSLICGLLCFLMFTNTSCIILSTSESEKESTSYYYELDEEEKEGEESNFHYYELDEEVKASILAYFEKTGETSDFLEEGCYYGEYEGKHVFFSSVPALAESNLYVGCFRMPSPNGANLWVWDDSGLTVYVENCNIFDFDSAREIALVHSNHTYNGCLYSKKHLNKCAFKDGGEVVEVDYFNRWAYLSGATIELPKDSYGLKGYYAEQTPLLSGKIDISYIDMGLLPGEFEHTNRYVLTIENIVGYEEKFAFYGTVSDIEELCQITGDAWLESYAVSNHAENVDLEKIKRLKYYVPIKPADPSVFNVEICLVVDMSYVGDAYVLVIKVNEETGQRYVSEIYCYKKEV